ncbi:GIY-YIG endonuclease [Arabidopsis thaliana x Arabidopsis arenosa]|uniref:GIY-YIG endonuclease n=1 Tax=Arabidopsis thaliana x Arabidopsis arenosa TaxID=1240361 RepID=A0A8T2A974_9BRAS|nr:GIY-YIG endonuclease [Arabidopsis thaliana x Arabidopsis arenosa]
MLNLPAWNRYVAILRYPFPYRRNLYIFLCVLVISLNLTVNYFSSKYAHHGGKSPSLPLHMKVQVCALDDLQYFTKLDNGSQPEDEESPEDNEENEEEEDSSNQSQPGNADTSSTDDLYPGEKELHDQHFENAKVPVTVFDEEDRLANFSGFGLLEEETVEDEVSHITVGSIEATEKEPETVFNDRLATFTGFGLVEIVEDEASHGTVGSTEAMEKDCRKRRNLITSTTTEVDVEVIDLMTPSPSCRAGSSMKRRRVSEFIDLTMSPNFIEL